MENSLQSTGNRRIKAISTLVVGLNDKALHQKVWRLAWPMIISNLSLPLLGLADTAIMGHLDDSQYLAAVGVGATLFSTIYWGVGFLKASITGLTAGAFGLAQHSRLKTLILMGLVKSLLIGLCLILLQSWLLYGALYVFSPPGDVQQHLVDYFKIRIWGGPAALSTLVVIGWFIGHQNTKVPMFLAIFTNGINIVLNLFFVFQMEMGVSGVAWGTLISEWLGLFYGIYFIRRQLFRLPGNVELSMLFDFQAYKSMFHIHAHYFVRTLFLMLTFIFFTRQGAVLGKDILALNEILKNFLLMIALGLDGFAHAAEAMMGAAWAGRKKAEFFNTCRVICFWSILTSISLTFCFAVGAESLVGLLTNIDEILALAPEYLIWIVCLPLVSFACFILDGIFIGTALTKVMRDNMIFSVVCVFFPVWFCTQHWGNHGLWFSMLSFFASRSLGLSFQYYRKFCQS